MLNQNSPARKGEAVDCLLGGDNLGHSIRTVRAQFIRSRTAVSLDRADLLARLFWGEAA